MTKHDIDKAYVSPYDKFLFEFDASHEKSESQLKEIAKHKKIAMRRDNANGNDSDEKIWEGF
jgi:hypothetical protein